MANFTSAHTGAEIDAAITVAKTVFLDSINGDDGNDGLTPDTPVQTVAAANALLEDGNTLRVARNSVVYRGAFNTKRHLTVRPYGSGRRPIFTSAKEIPAVSWSLYSGNIYKATVVHDVATNASNDPAFYCQFAIFDDVGDSFMPARMCGLKRITAKSGGDNIPLATHIAEMTAGSFTVRRTGADDASPFNPSATTFDYYVWLADGSNPGSNGRTIRYVEQSSVASFGYGCDIEGIDFCRSGSKDHLSGGAGTAPGSAGRLHDIRIIDASVHGSVIRCSTYTKYYAEKNPYASFGGAGNGLHLYRSEGYDGVSRGAWLDDVEIVGFETGILCHGDGSEPGASTNAFEQWEMGSIKIRDCGLAMNVSEVGTDVHVKSFHASGGYLDAGVEGNRGIKSDYVQCVVDDFSFYSQIYPDGSRRNIQVLSGNVTINNGWCYIQPAAEGAYPSLAVASGNGRIILKNFTVINGPLFTVSFSEGVTLEAYDSILGRIGQQPTAIIASNCQILDGAKTLAEIQADHPGVADDCLVPYYDQPWSHVVEASEITTIDWGTADGVAGAAFFLSNKTDLETRYNLKIVGVDGGNDLIVQQIARDAANDSGGKYAYTSNVTSLPESFTGATVQIVRMQRDIFPEDAGTLTLSSTSNAGWASEPSNFTAGQIVRLGAMAGREAFGLYRVQSVDGEDVYFVEDIPWQTQTQYARSRFYASITQTPAGDEPFVSMSFGFPIDLKSNENWGVNGTITYVTGGTLDFTAYRANAAGTIDSDKAGANTPKIQTENGVVPWAFNVNVGDQIDLTARVFIREWTPAFSGNPTRDRAPYLANGSVLAAAGMGWRDLR